MILKFLYLRLVWPIYKQNLASMKILKYILFGVLGLVFLFSERISTYLIEILVQDCCPDGVCCEVSSIPCFASCISLRNTSTNVSLRESLRFDDKQTNLPDLCFTKGEEWVDECWLSRKDPQTNKILCNLPRSAMGTFWHVVYRFHMALEKGSWGI